MTHLNFNHIVAVQDAIRVFETGLNDGREAKYHKALEKDIRYLIEARDILKAMYDNPTLPFNDAEPSLAQSILNDIDNEPNEAF